MLPIGPFSGPQVAQLFDVFGIPASGMSMNTIALVMYPFSNVDTWNPAFNSGNMTTIVNAIKAQLALVDVDTATIVNADLVTWQTIRDSEMKVSQDENGAQGTIIDDMERRRILRIRIANNCGISVPKDGYLAELEAVYGKSLKEFRAGGGGFGGLGDR